MKTNSLIVLAAAGLLLSVQFTQSASSADATITGRGPHHRVWELTEQVETPLGRAVERKRSYVELETGMHAWRNGQYVETKAQVVLTAEGAAATNTAHQVFSRQI